MSTYALDDNMRNFVVGPPDLGSITYEYDYFSGSQIQVLIGDILIDECVGITFAVQQSKTPVFGFASQYYTFVADGHVLVTGELTIAFKEAGYLLQPMKRFIERVRNNGNNSPIQISEDRYMQMIRLNIEQMIEYEQTGNRDILKMWVELQHLPDDQFEDWAESFEDYLWFGGDTASPLSRDKMFSKNLTEQDSFDLNTMSTHRRADQYPPIDIWIAYGDINVPAANHTVKKLLDVTFTGQVQTIEVSGNPVFEQYPFIARNHV